MNKKQAIKENLYFTGHYASAWDHKEIETIKAKAKELRKDGYRAVMVTDSNRTSVYVEERFSQDRAIAGTNKEIGELDLKLDRARAEYEEELERILNQQATLIARLKKLKQGL